MSFSYTVEPKCTQNIHCGFYNNAICESGVCKYNTCLDPNFGRFRCPLGSYCKTETGECVPTKAFQLGGINDDCGHEIQVTSDNINELIVSLDESIPILENAKIFHWCNNGLFCNRQTNKCRPIKELEPLNPTSVGEGKQCGFINGTVYHRCDQDMTCQFNLGETLNIIYQYSLPENKTGICTKVKRKQQLGDDCSWIANCDYGLACIEGKCQRQKGVASGNACQSDSDCYGTANCIPIGVSLKICLNDFDLITFRQTETVHLNEPAMSFKSNSDNALVLKECPIGSYLDNEYICRKLMTFSSETCDYDKNIYCKSGFYCEEESNKCMAKSNVTFIVSICIIVYASILFLLICNRTRKIFGYKKVASCDVKDNY